MFPGSQSQSHNLSVTVQVDGQVITDNDISRALVKAQDQVIAPNMELIHTIAGSLQG